MTATTMTFLENAQRAVARGLAFGRERDLAMAIVVVNSAGSVCAAATMDGTLPGAFDIVRAKANTAVQFRASTVDLKGRLQLENKLALAQIVAHVVFLGGGVPIRDATGVVVGGIGVGGSSEADDDECAQQCLAAFAA